MIVWTVTGGACGAADTLHRAAQEACTAALAWLTAWAPEVDVGDHLPAARMCVDTADILVGPRYTRTRPGGELRYDPAVTAAHGRACRDHLIRAVLHPDEHTDTEAGDGPRTRAQRPR